MLRVISAFLFASVLMVICYSGFWYYSMIRAQESLMHVVSDMWGAEVSYDKTEVRYDPVQVHVGLKNLEVAFSDEDNTFYSILVDDVDFKADFFGAYKLDIGLPKSFTFKIQPMGGEVKRYDIQMEGGSFAIFPEQNEISLSFLVAMVREGGEEFLRIGIGDVVLKNEGNKFAFNTLLKDVKGQLFNDGKQIDMSSLMLQGDVTNAPDFYEILLAVLKDRSVANFEEIQKNIIKYAVAHDTALSIEDVSWWEGKKQSVSIKAGVRLDERERLWGEIEIATSKQQLFTELLTRTKLLGFDDLEFNFSLKKVMERQHQAPFRYTIRINQGDVMVSGIKAGVAPSLGGMLGI